MLPIDSAVPIPVFCSKRGTPKDYHFPIKSGRSTLDPRPGTTLSIIRAWISCRPSVWITGHSTTNCFLESSTISQSNTISPITHPHSIQTSIGSIANCSNSTA